MLAILVSAPAHPPQLNVPMLIGFLLAFGLLTTWALRAMRAATPKRPSPLPMPREFIGDRFDRLGDFVEPTPAQRSRYWLN